MRSSALREHEMRFPRHYDHQRNQKKNQQMQGKVFDNSNPKDVKNDLHASWLSITNDLSPTASNVRSDSKSNEDNYFWNEEQIWERPTFTTDFASSSAITSDVSSSSPSMYFTCFDTANFSSCVTHTRLHFSYSKRTSCTFTRTSNSWSSQHCRDFSLLCTFAHFPLVVPFIFILPPLLLYFLHPLKHGSLFY